MLNNARRIMNERTELANKANAVIRDAQAALKELGFETVQNLEEVIPTTIINKEDKTAPVIMINKGKIIEIPVVNEEEIDKLHKEIGRHIGRINQLAAENEQLTNELKVYKGMAAGYEAQLQNKNLTIESLEKQIADMKEDKLRAEIKETKANNNTKGGDSVSKLDLLKKIKKAPEFTLEQAVKEQEDKIAKEQEEKEARKTQMPKYNLNYTEVTFNEAINSDTMFGVCGTLTIEDKEYAFKATNNHNMPIIYGCFDMDTIKLAKEIITNDVERFNFSNDKDMINYDHINDTTGRLVVWRLADEKGNVSYHGYSDNYIIAWNANKFNVPSRKMMKYALDENPKHFRKIEQQKNAKKLSDKFMAVCKNIWPEDFTNDDNDPEPTKAATKITKDEISNMIHERHQRAKENRIENIQSAIRYNGPVVDYTKAMQQNNTDGSDELDEDIDL